MFRSKPIFINNYPMTYQYIDIGLDIHTCVREGLTIKETRKFNEQTKNCNGLEALLTLSLDNIRPHTNVAKRIISNLSPLYN